jgi:hypothetical protein
VSEGGDRPPVAPQIRVRVDNGIAKMWNRRQISASSYCDQSHYLHPHPYSMQLPIWTALPPEPLSPLVDTHVRCHRHTCAIHVRHASPLPAAFSAAAAARLRAREWARPETAVSRRERESSGQHVARRRQGGPGHSDGLCVHGTIVLTAPPPPPALLASSPPPPVPAGVALHNRCRSSNTAGTSASESLHLRETERCAHAWRKHTSTAGGADREAT